MKDPLESVAFADAVAPEFSWSSLVAIIIGYAVYFWWDRGVAGPRKIGEADRLYLWMGLALIFLVNLEWLNFYCHKFFGFWLF